MERGSSTVRIGNVVATSTHPCGDETHIAKYAMCGPGESYSPVIRYAVTEWESDGSPRITVSVNAGSRTQKPEPKAPIRGLLTHYRAANRSKRNQINLCVNPIFFVSRMTDQQWVRIFTEIPLQP